MTEFKLTVALCDEDRARVDRLITAIEGLPARVALASLPVAPIANVPVAPVSVVPAPEHPADVHPVESPFPEPAPTPEPAKVSEPAPVEYTLDQVRKRVNDLVAGDEAMRAKVKAIVSKYADKVVHIKKADYPAFMADLEALNG